MILQFRSLVIVAVTLAALLAPTSAMADAAGDQYTVAAAHYSQGRWNLALFEFRAFVADHPKHPQAESARFYIGESLVQLRQYAEAARQFHKLVADYPGSQQTRKTLFRAGEASYFAGDIESAQRDLEQFVDRYATDKLNCYVLAYLGEIALEQGKHKTAEKFCSQCLAEYPAGPLADDCRATLVRIGVAKIRMALLAGDHDTVEKQAREFARRYPTHELHATVEELEIRSLLVRKEFGKAAEKLELRIAASLEESQSAGDRYLLALACQGLGRHAEALQLLDQAQNSESLKKDVGRARAASLLALGRFSDAIGSLEPTLARGKEAGSPPVDDDGTLQARAQLTICYARVGRLDDARRAFSKLAGERPKHDLIAPTAEVLAEAILAQAQKLSEQNEFDQALELYDDVIEQHHGEKQLATALLGAARVHAQLGQREKAIANYRRLLADHPKASNRDLVIYNLAWMLRESGRSAEGDTLFEELRHEHPGSRFWADAVYRLAEGVNQSGDRNGAKKLLAELIATKPTGEVLAHALYLEAQSFVAEEKWTELVAPLERLVRECHSSALKPLAGFWIAEADYRMGKDAEALERFTKLDTQRSSPTTTREAWTAMIPLRRAQLLARARQWPEASEIAERIVREYPNFEQQYEVDYLLGRCLASEARFDEARAKYRAVIESTRGSKTETAAMAQWMTGESYFHQKNYEAAIREYLRVDILYAFPTWQAAALLQAAKCHELLGQPREAVALYNQILKKHPNSSFTTEASRRLEQTRK
jgi:TolA-binding protein